MIALLLLAYFAPICFPGDGPPALETSSEGNTEVARDDANTDMADSTADASENERAPTIEKEDSAANSNPSADESARNSTESESQPTPDDSSRPTTDSDHRPGGTYYVQQGDTLTDISRRIYGTTGRWKEIYDANRDKIKDPDNIFPGEVLSLP
ncbi:MAG: hypothetical protein CMN77_10505 [Spirochaetaceae bacterium]|nr:hypothetical protein [Spirochaetaceae bacterium]